MTGSYFRTNLKKKEGCFAQSFISAAQAMAHGASSSPLHGATV
jgi:hypothetical protein